MLKSAATAFDGPNLP